MKAKTLSHLIVAETEAKAAMEFFHAARLPGAALNDLIESGARRLQTALRYAFQASQSEFKPFPDHVSHDTEEDNTDGPIQNNSRRARYYPPRIIVTPQRSQRGGEH